MLYFPIPSIKTSSPTKNGAVVNPKDGVSIEHVNIPVELEITVLIPTPLLLLVVNISIGLSDNPKGLTIISMPFIELPTKFVLKTPLLIFSLVIESTRFTFGDDKYPLPDSLTVTTPMVFEFLIVINGDMNALGFKVLSDEYSNPSLIILIWFVFPIDFDLAITCPPLPSVEEVPTKLGNF